jgi:hypothetical protein
LKSPACCSRPRFSTIITSLKAGAQLALDDFGTTSRTFVHCRSMCQNVAADADQIGKRRNRTRRDVLWYCASGGRSGVEDAATRRGRQPTALVGLAGKPMVGPATALPVASRYASHTSARRRATNLLK